MEYIRKHYGVPAKRGGRIRFTGTSDGCAVDASICSAKNGYLIVQFDHMKRRATLHPTWMVEYL